MFQDSRGPIEAFDWGEFTIVGKQHRKGKGAGKDVRVVGTEVSEWEERKGHLLTPDMITGVFKHGIEVLIIGNGVHGLLECPAKVREKIVAKGIPDVRVLPTPDACREYNRLFHEGRKVALLAHGTC
ncbi:MAG TPA: Mth938-like domain-containing protein [Candidatus Latescibacteria bacterium]|nr:Mth938-like domain-containing protein [Candidatus Latescibacterota bacterium]HPC46150.1 Mth938-like domain-containing protein [Candidatus Latescibacterota bacterium]HQE61683.1 Mth938-like domain-containing protein [Candidatus Latescibacterota bacterium]